MRKHIFFAVLLIIIGILIIQFGRQLSRDATDIGCDLCPNATVTYQYVFLYVYGLPTKTIRDEEFCAIAGCSRSTEVPVFIDVYALGGILMGVGCLLGLKGLRKKN